MTKRALCVGIDQYPAPNTLHGCVADASSWGRSLQGNGFAVNFLTDGAATLQGFLNAVKNIIAAAVPGDVVAITYSGHGCKSPSVNGQIYAEGLVPIDFDSKGFIVDSDVGPIFDSAKPGVAINFILDSCFSGAAERFLGFTNTVRALPDDVRARRIIATPELILIHQASYAQRHLQRALTVPGLLREAIFAASGDTQVSLENENGGYFTQCAVQAMKLYSGLSNNAFLAQVQTLIAKLPPDFGSNGGQPQHPQLRCPADLQTAPFLGALVPDAPGPVVPVQPGPIALAGACHLPANPTGQDIVAYLKCISDATRNFQLPYQHQ